MKWFTADLHLDNENVIDYCNRPYTGKHRVDKMNKDLIFRYNSLVQPDDDVYILGDFSFRSEMFKSFYDWVIPKLNGRKHLILGNHDKNSPWFYVDKGIHSVHCPYLEVEEFICVHDPALSQVDRSKKFLCGHVHDLFLKVKNCVNVGVDVHNYSPVDINTIREIFKIEGDVIFKDSSKYKEDTDLTQEHNREHD